MDESLKDIYEIKQQLKVANKLAVIKELYALEEIDKETYVRMLMDYMKNN